MPSDKTKADDNGIRVVGEIVFEFQEHSDGNWYSKIKPNIISTDIREIYKLGLICAVLQDTCQKKLGAIDTLIKTRQEITKIHNELVEEKQAEKKGKAVADVDKYQTELPFEEAPDGNALEDNGYNPYDGIHD